MEGGGITDSSIGYLCWGILRRTPGTGRMGESWVRGFQVEVGGSRRCARHCRFQPDHRSRASDRHVEPQERDSNRKRSLHLRHGPEHGGMGDLESKRGGRH